MEIRTWARGAFSAAILLGCSDPSGPVVPTPPPSLVVRVTTTGSAASLDADGYSLEIDGVGQPVSGAAVVNIHDLAPGIHTVNLSGVAANCAVSANNRSVQIPANGQIVVALFLVSCQENSGTLEISATTVGEDVDPDGYRVLVLSAAGTVLDITANANGQSSHVLPAGFVTLRIQGIRSNCSINGGVERQVNISHATVVTVRFEGQCQAMRAVRFIMVTTGDRPDTNGYHAEMRLNNNLADSFTLPSNGTRESARLTPGTYSVRMWGIQLNCHTPFAGTATVGADVDTEIRITVTCAEPFELAYSVGVGAASDIKVTNSTSDFIKPVVSTIGRDFDPAWSPDGRKLVFAGGLLENSDIYVADADGSNRIQLTDHVARDYRPAWSPDGKSIAFVSERTGDPEIYVMKADGSDQVRITTHNGVDIDPAWSPDGSKLAFARVGPSGGTGIFIMNPDGSDVRRLTDNPQGDSQPAWSPDGSRLAFTRIVGLSRSDIYLVNPDGSALSPFTNSFAVVSDPDWSPDAKQIAFSQDSFCDYYYYDCVSQILVARLGDGPGGVEFLATSNEDAFNPSWRPRK
jgi:hypothetical protein